MFSKSFIKNLRKKNDDEIIEQIDKQTDLLEKDKEGHDMMWHLIQHNKIDAVKHLIDLAKKEGCLDKMLNYQDSQGRTRVHQMAFYRALDCLNLLIEEHRDFFDRQVNKTAHHLETPIYSLVYNPNSKNTIETLNILLENDAQIQSNSRNKFLHELAARFDAETFKEFLEVLKDHLEEDKFRELINAQDHDCANNQEDQKVHRQRSPIFYAIIAEKPENTQTLIDYGADLELSDECGLSPEFWLIATPSTIIGLENAKDLIKDISSRIESQ